MTTERPFCVEIPVAWGDMDAFGHVNNTIYLRWFESARIAFFHAMQIPHREAERTEAPILAQTRCSFELPLTYPDTVRVECTIGRIGTKSFTMNYAVHSEQHGRRAAQGDGVIVWYDYARAQTVPLPEPLRQRLAAHVVE